MSKRRTLLLTVVLATVAMLAISGMAWAQQGSEPQATTTATQGDKTTAGQGSSTTAAPVIPSDNKGPKIKPKNPKPGSKIKDRTPTIKAKITDNNGTVKKSGIKLFLDGKKKDFKFKSGKGLVKFTPNKNLSFGKHTVKVKAKDNKGRKNSKTWSFRVKQS
jgi:hypothetical protein